MKRRIWAVIPWLQFSSLFAQQRPLVTEPVETVRPGYVRVDTGVEFLQEAVFAFSGLKGELTRAGVTALRIGAGEVVELQVLGAFQNLLNVESRYPAPNTPRLNFSGAATSDFGDLTLATKVGLRKEHGKWPALGMRFGMELPNAKNEKGLGNDETNVFSSFLLEKHVGRLRLVSNVGLAILGDPVTPGAQDDLYTYGLALLYPIHSRVILLGDAYGRVGAGGIGTEEQSMLRLGAQIRAAGLYWDVALLLGLRQTDPSSGLIVGVSREFRFPWLGF